jgi:SAM-dependent methyltransferase
MDVARTSTSYACRGCGADLRDVFVDLGLSPLANAFPAADELQRPERFFPLCAYVCAQCRLVQLPAHADPETIFGEYAYFSSYADSWLEHARRFALDTVARRGLDHDSLVVELASNDGYLLRWFRDAGVPVLGIEPARNVAIVARAQGIETIAEFFGVALAQRFVSERRRADLVVANNVLAHVPDLHDFVGGIELLLAPHGVASIEFPHLMRLIEGVQYDTIYHEHFSYFSLLALEPVLAAHGLRVVDVEELATHGGSLRVWVGRGEPEATVAALREAEQRAGLDQLETYVAFAERVRANKRVLLRFLLDAADRGETVAAYGAPAKGNTLLNYAGVRSDLIAYTVDRNPYKQGRFLPGSRIPIYSPQRLLDDPPDHLLVLPWNLLDEVRAQMAPLVAAGTRFVVAIPDIRVPV